jgi:hypothetical protein
MNNTTKFYKELLQECNIITDVLLKNNPYFINREFIEYYNKNREKLQKVDLIKEYLKNNNHSIPKFNKSRIVLFIIIIVIIYRIAYSIIFPDDPLLNKRLIPFLLGVPSIYIYYSIRRLLMKPKIKKAYKAYSALQHLINENIRK